MTLRTTGEKIDDEALGNLLEALGALLKANYESGNHLACLYDLSKPRLPPFAESYRKVKQLAAWCRLQCDEATGASHLDATIHSIAILLPSGIGSKLLTNCVSFFLWICKPPMEPRVFEGNATGARAFLEERQQKYLNGDLLLCPPLLRQDQQQQQQQQQNVPSGEETKTAAEAVNSEKKGGGRRRQRKGIMMSRARRK